LTLTQLQPSSVALTKAGAGTLVVNTLRANSVAINAGLVRIIAGAGNAGVSQLTSLTIASAAALDLTDSKLVTASPVGSWSGSAYTEITGLVQRGYSGGTWSGSGIITSSSNGNLTTLAVATAGETGKTTFAGVSVTTTETLVMHTYAGDANLDGKINVDDYGRIDFNVNLNVAGWFNGDFNYDGKINVDDYGIIDFNVGIQGLPFSTGVGVGGIAAVPEPASLNLLALAVGALAPPRRRLSDPSYRRQP